MVASGGLYAATIRYHSGTFYIVCTNVSTTEESGTANFLISTKDIWADEWTNPIYFPFSGIDPSVFFDSDGKVYVQGSWQIDRLKQPSCTLKQFEIDIQTGKALSEIREIWPGYARYDTEGPHIYKRDGYYYLLAAEGGTFEHHLLSIARSRSIWGPYESYGGNPIMTADGKPEESVQNVGHGDLFQDQSGLWWALVLGVRNDDGRFPLGRETFLTPVDWPEGGWLKIEQPRMQFSHSSIHSAQNDGSDLLKAHKTNVDDVYIRDPNLSCYRSCTIDKKRDIYLRSSAVDLSALSASPSFIGKRQRSLESVATVTVENIKISSDESLRAGIALYLDNVRHAVLLLDFASSSIEFKLTNSATGLNRTVERELAPEAASAVELKITASRNSYMFEYRSVITTDDPWQTVAEVDVMELFARDFTGPILGVYANGTADSEVHFKGFSVVG